MSVSRSASKGKWRTAEVPERADNAGRNAAAASCRNALSTKKKYHPPPSMTHKSMTHNGAAARPVAVPLAV
jgi:hypothetical protein